jgi:hypothetical protein
MLLLAFHPFLFPLMSILTNITTQLFVSLRLPDTIMPASHIAMGFRVFLISLVTDFY